MDVQALCLRVQSCCSSREASAVVSHGRGRLEGGCGQKSQAQEGRAAGIGPPSAPQRGMEQASLAGSKGASPTHSPVTPASSHLLLPATPTFLHDLSCRAPLWENVPGPREPSHADETPACILLGYSWEKEGKDDVEEFSGDMKKLRNSGSTVPRA